MKTKKTSTFIYKGLGIPVKLINVPMKKMLGEWFIDVNMETLQRIVLEALIHKPFSLTGAELRYIRNYMEMSCVDFGKTFGVSHVAVVKWENEKNGISPALELYIRLYVKNEYSLDLLVHPHAFSNDESSYFHLRQNRSQSYLVPLLPL